MKVLTRSDMIQLWRKAALGCDPASWTIGTEAACIQAAAIEWAAYVGKQVGGIITHTRDAYHDE